MVNELLQTKLQIPPLRAGIVERSRLLALLNEALPQKDAWQRRLTLVSAPAGYGKSTLLSAWSRQLPCRAAWLSLDAEDNDPVRFLAYLVAALQSIGLEVDADVQAKLGTPAAASRALLISLVNDITTRAPCFVLVLDDYHLIEKADVHELLAFLLQQLPPQMHLAIATRADPPLPLPLLRSQGLLAEVRTEALRFAGAESAAFLNKTMALSLSAPEAATLETRTEGWIAGLQLAALALRGRQGEEAARFVADFGGTHRYILDYLLDEVLRHQPAEIQQFLLHTSILERLSAPLCDHLLEDDAQPDHRPESYQILHYLDTHNLFLVPLDEQRCWYRYHQLFAALLQAQLQSTEPERLPGLHGRASSWFEAAGFVDEAIGHALAGEAVDRAALLVEQNAAQLVNDGQLALLARRIETLPVAVVGERPWLAVFAGWASYWRGARDEVEQHLRRAEALMTTEVVAGPLEQMRLRAHLALIRAHKALQDENIDDSAALVREVDRLLPEIGASAGFARRLVPMVRGLTAWGEGDVTGATAAFQDVRQLALADGHPWEAIAPACYESLQLIRQGRLHEAQYLLEAALATPSVAIQAKNPVRGFAYLRLGDIAREWNKLEQAAAYLEQGIGLCEQWGLADAVVDGYVMLARLHFAHADLDAMKQALRSADAVQDASQVDPFVCTWLDDCRLRLWLYEGNFAAVRHWVRASGLGIDSPLCYLRDLDHLNLALALVGLARHEQNGTSLHGALALLARLLAATADSGWVNEQIRVLLLQAVALEIAGDMAGATSATSHALELAAPGGHVRRFLDDGAVQPGDRPLIPLLRRELERGVLPAYVAHILRQLPETVAKETVPSTVPASALVEPLSTRELEVLRLIAAGLSNREIGIELSISLATVKWHASNLYGKLNAGHRTEAVAFARALGVLP